eukprot:scaffold3784_cov174-Amphora_coffeaeformis.AAC.14
MQNTGNGQAVQRVSRFLHACGKLHESIPIFDSFKGRQQGSVRDGIGFGNERIVLAVLAVFFLMLLLLFHAFEQGDGSFHVTRPCRGRQSGVVPHDRQCQSRGAGLVQQIPRDVTTGWLGIATGRYGRVIDDRVGCHLISLRRHALQQGHGSFHIAGPGTGIHETAKRVHIRRDGRGFQ